MAKKKVLKMNQKQKLNAIALGTGAVGVTSIALATKGAWPTPEIVAPATEATGFYADVHSNVGSFINFLGLSNGALVAIGIGAVLLAVYLFRK